MARRGPKGLTEAQKIARGTDQPCRKVEVLFADHAARADPEDIPSPAGMTAAAKKIWRTKVERYRQRGQKVQGFEDGLRQYCELEAMLNDATKRGTATASLLNCYRSFAAEFYDTPASRRVPAEGSAKPHNAFARNGVKTG